MTQPHPAWDTDYHQMTRTEYDQLLQQRRWQLDADHTTGTLTDPEHTYLREHVAAVDPQALREQVTYWAPTITDEQTTAVAGEPAAVSEQLGEAAPLPHEIAERAAQLYRTGQYPDYIQAHHAAAQQTIAEAYRQAVPTNDWHGSGAPPPAEPPHTSSTQAGHLGTRQREHVENQVLAAAEQLDPADGSLPARQLRETAASIRDHRSSPTRIDAGPAADPHTGTQPPERVQQSTDLAVAALQVRDCLNQLSSPPAAGCDQVANSTTNQADQAATDDY